MITRMAYYDTLTGLPNRILFLERAKVALAYLKRKKQRGAAIFLDLDGFKYVNDQFGHSAGDFVLHQFAERLKSKLRQTDTLARFGGDEFVIFVGDLKPEADIPIVIQKIHSALDEPFVYQNHQLKLGASIGVSVYPTHSEDIHALLKIADNAMYQAKNSPLTGYYVAGSKDETYSI